MDAFYASVEQRDDPGLRGRPVAVGGAGGRGVVMAASYEARRFGVRSAMPSTLARRLCPDLIVVPPRFAAYREASRCVHGVFAEWTELVEPLALDEAYLDVSSATEGPVGGLEVARTIKDRIRALTGLTASAGVSFNKFLAKRASDAGKPDGLLEIGPDDAAAFLANLPIEQFPGVGQRTAARLRVLGLQTGGDLQRRGEVWLQARLGRFGVQLWALSQGRDERPVDASRERRSSSVEHTFERDLVDPDDLAARLRGLAAELAGRLERSGFRGRVVMLKIKLSDFTVLTRRATAPRPVWRAEDLCERALRLLFDPAPPDRPVRLLGLGTARAATEDPRQLGLRLAVTDQGNGQS